MTEYTLTPELAARLIRAMRWVEAQPSMGASGNVTGYMDTPNQQFIVPDGTSETDGGITYWAAVVKVWDTGSEAWTECGDCWAMSPADSILTADYWYPARQSGPVNPNSAGELPLFIICDACSCGDPGTVPGGWTESDEACYFDLIQTRCNSGTTEYSRVRIFNYCGKFKTWTGPWGTTNPPAEPS